MVATFPNGLKHNKLSQFGTSELMEVLHDESLKRLGILLTFHQFAFGDLHRQQTAAAHQFTTTLIVNTFEDEIVMTNTVFVHDDAVAKGKRHSGQRKEICQLTIQLFGCIRVDVWEQVSTPLAVEDHGAYE